MKSPTQVRQRSPAGRRIAGRAQQDHIRDPYQQQRKLEEPTACRECGAVYHRGRWQWGPKPTGAHEDLCPACRRIRDRLPAGILTLHGEFALQHEQEITGLARNEEAAEKGEHPLNRVAGIERTDAGLVITTTDIHLPRRIGEALKRAYRGTLKTHFDETGYFFRGDWRPPT